jgi:hypothetical protein
LLKETKVRVTKSKVSKKQNIKLISIKGSKGNLETNLIDLKGSNRSKRFKTTKYRLQELKY